MSEMPNDYKGIHWLQQIDVPFDEITV